MVEGRRARNKRMARESILEAMAAHVSERGLLDFSIPEIARMAGVSHRTVYNYFPNREALLDEFSTWANQRMDELAGISFPDDLSDLPDAARRYFRAFSEMPGITTAFARIDASSPDALVPRDYRDRRAAFRKLVAVARPDASEAQVDAVTGLLAVLGSSRTWHRLTSDHGLDGSQAGVASGWLMDLLIAAVGAGDLPAIPEGVDDGGPATATGASRRSGGADKERG